MEIPLNLHPIKEFVDIDGKVEKIKYYRFADGIFSFWEMKLNERQSTIFRVRIDSDPAERAIQKGLPAYKSIYPANLEDIDKWIKSHPDYPVLES